MIDWSKLGGPTNSPVPNTPETTAPIAPATPGGIPPISAPPVPQISQAQVDAMDPGARVGRGIDTLGQALFGQGNGSFFGGLPGAGGLASVLGGAGDVAHAAGTVAVAPIEIGASVASHVPLGWVPGGADDTFKQLGDWAKVHDPVLYDKWQKANAASAGDVLGGGNLKADFNMEATQYIDDQLPDSQLGTTPTLAMGKAGVGSLGGALSNAIQGWLGLGSNTIQRAAGAAGAFDPSGLFGHHRTFEQAQQDFKAGMSLDPDAQYALAQLQSGKFTEQQARDYFSKNVGQNRNRIEESMARLDRGDEVSPVEKNAIDQVRSGAWTMNHAEDYLVSHGVGITRNPIGQALGTVATDPLTYATLGAGAIAATGAAGARLTEAGVQASSTYEKLAATVAAVQKSELGPAFRIARGLFDPLGVYKPNAEARAITDLMNGTALSGLNRGAGPLNIKDVRSVAREFNKADEVDTAMASYAIDQARLMVAKHAQETLLDPQGVNAGEELLKGTVGTPDQFIAPIEHAAARDAETQVADEVQRNLKNTFTADERDSLAGRMSVSIGETPNYWAKRLASVSDDVKSIWHFVTYKLAEKDFMQAMGAIDKANYTGDLPLHQMTLITGDTLDNITAENIIDSLRTVLKDEQTPDRIAAATAEWNAQAERYPIMASIGHAPGGQSQLNELIDELDHQLQSGAITRRATDEELGDPALRSVRDMLDRNTVDGKPLWNIGFRPDEEVAWGVKRDLKTGLPVYDRAPTISHVVDAVPGRQPFSDTTRNALGQIVGKSAAERLNRPIDSLEAYINTFTDGVTGARLVNNISRRFERSTFDAGIPKDVSRSIFAKAREIAALDRSTIRGIKPDNLWDAIAKDDLIPRNLVLKDGSTMNVHVIMDHLMQAAEGDFRVMGVSSKLSQRMRNALRQAGDGGNLTGQLTVTQYNKMRYAFNPMFIIQRVTDAPYYSILYGTLPVGKNALTASKGELRAIEERMAQTGLARDFSMDMPEFATRSNFTEGVKTQMQQAGIDSHRLQLIHEAPDAIITSQMTNMLHARMGNIVKGAFDNLKTLAEKDPALKARMLEESDILQQTFGDIRRIYSDQAGRVLSDDETAVRYMSDMFNSNRRQVVHPDGSLDFQDLIAEGERVTPANIGEIPPLRPDRLARELGYEDAAALRADVKGRMVKQGTTFNHVPGENDIASLEEAIRTQVGASPQYTQRAMAYFNETWDDFWYRLSRPLDHGGLDISPHYAKEAQGLIADWARSRGMDPWEYLSGVMATNIGAKDLETHIGQLMAFLKAGKAEQPLEEWTKMFRATLDVSAQETLMNEFDAALPKLIQKSMDAGDTATSQALNRIAGLRKGGTAASGGAVKPWRPKISTRIENVAIADLKRFIEIDRNAVPKGGGLSTDLAQLAEDIKANGIQQPLTMEVDKRTGTALLTDGNHRLAAAEQAGLTHVPVVTKAAKRLPSETDLTKAPAGFKPIEDTAGDAYDAYFESHFPEIVRQRIESGTPHPNPEVEGYVQQFSKWVQETLGPELGARTRHDLRRLVEAVPTEQATPFNRTHGLIAQLLKDKITDAQNDVFRLAEMQTKRSVLERSLNHPLFGLYPASYMWGKVLPETVKFIAKNPFAATYMIADVQRAIATQREYDREMDDKIGGIDRSSGAFLLDYLTPGLPWSDHSARTSPLVQDLFKGKEPTQIALDEFGTMSPERWWKQLSNTGGEISGFVNNELQSQPNDNAAEPAVPQWEVGLQNLSAGGAPVPNAATPQITGPVNASGLAPILKNDLDRLSSILLEGKSAEQ